MSWGVIAIATTAISTAATMYGQYQAGKAQEQAAKWNADQARKQAAYDEKVAQENMRRKRDNNRRELARRRAQAAGAGLKETGVVVDSLIETDKRLQKDVDDIWDRAAMNSSTLYGKANMSIWEGKVARQAAKTDMFSTAVSGAGRMASIGQKMK